MSSGRNESYRPLLYRIEVLGALDPGWSDWLGGLEVCTQQEANGSLITVITGRVADQAALRGILAKIWDLNLNVISVSRC